MPISAFVEELKHIRKVRSDRSIFSRNVLFVLPSGRPRYQRATQDILLAH